MKKSTYVLTVSERFPQGHLRAGEETQFISRIISRIKLHTIRENFPLWFKRAEKINRGEAVLSVRCWSGKPYNSKQIEMIRFSEIGVEKLERSLLGWFVNDIDSPYTRADFARNDGLSLDDFNSWFKGETFTSPKAIIHFTDFRYDIRL